LYVPSAQVYLHVLQSPTVSSTSSTPQIRTYNPNPILSHHAPVDRSPSLCAPPCVYSIYTISPKKPKTLQKADFVLPNRKTNETEKTDCVENYASPPLSLLPIQKSPLERLRSILGHVMYFFSTQYLQLLVHFFGDAQLGASRTIISLQLFFRSCNRFARDHTQRLYFIAKKIFLHFTLKLSFKHEIFHQPIFQRMIRHDH